MRKLIAIATVLTVLPVLSMSVSADTGKTAQQQCTKAAKKDHVSKDKMDAYMKTCVEKHSAKKDKDMMKDKDAAMPMPAK